MKPTTPVSDAPSSPGVPHHPSCGDHLDQYGEDTMHTLAPYPPLHSLRSFLFNVRKLGFCWWLRLALVNARNAILRRFKDP